MQPCGTNERWWVVADSELNARLYRRQLPNHVAFVALEGLLSAPGRYGHLGAYPRQVEVSRVVAVRLPTPRDCR